MNPSRRAALALFPLLALAACGAPPAAAPAAATGAATAAATAAASAPAAAPASAPAAVPASAPASAPAPASASASAPASPFHVITPIGGEVGLFPMGERAIATDGRHLFLIEGDEVRFDVKLMAGLENMYNDSFWAIARAGGSFPDAAFLAVIRPEARSGFHEIHGWTGSKWSLDRRTDNNMFISGVAPWSGGRTLALITPGTIGTTSFQPITGARGGALPALTPATGEDKGYCGSKLRPEVMTTLPSGHLFAAGSVCDQESNPPAVERWEPGKKQGTLDLLPRIPEEHYLDCMGIVARAPHDVWLAGTVRDRGKTRRAYLVHFDGKEWKQEQAPASGAVAGLWLQPDGVLWLAAGSELWTLAAGPGAAWSQVPLPKLPEDNGLTPPEILSVWPRAPGDVWALIEPQRGSALLLHTRPPKGRVELPEAEQIAEEVSANSMPQAITGYCQNIFVQLYTVSKVAPADYDFPTTREALKGHTEFADAAFVEVKRLDKRYFGAIVPDQEMGKKLAELVKKKVKGSTPQVVCFKPKVTRQLSIDLATGEVNP